MNIDTMKRKLKNLLREVDPDYDLGHNPTLVRLVERIIFICNDTFPQIRTLQQEVLDNTRKYSEEITDLKRAKEAREKEIAKLKKENRTHLDTIKEQGKTIADQQATIEELKKVTEEVTNLRESLEKAQTDRESEAKALTQKIEALNQRIVQQETLQKQSDETISREREKQDRQREKQEAEILSLRGLIANLSLEITQLKETGPPPLRLDGYFSAPPVQ